VVDAPADRAAGMLDRLERLVVASKSKALPRECLAPIEHVGVEANRLWAACGRVEGLSAAEWMIHNGRFPPEAVLEIARQMLPGLIALEEAAAAHGDVRPESLLLADDGRVVLLQPGLRAAVRPEEGYANADLPPEAYDCLAPERITEGTPPSPLGDVYACGCLWWHMLTGRPAVAGGTALAKLRAAQTVAIPDVRPLAPDTPELLAAAVLSCTRRDPSERPESLARLAAMLGPSTRSGRTSVLRCRGKPARRLDEWTAPAVPTQVFRPRPWWLAAIAGCLVAAAAVAWSISRGGLPIPTATIPAEQPEAARPTGCNPWASATPKQTGDDRPTPSPAKTLPSEPGRVEPLVLGSGGPVAGESLELLAGQCVRGEPGRRPLLTVPRGGLVVRVENVRFENIDFVWDHASADSSSTAGAALVHLQASRAEFHGCTFQSSVPPSATPAPSVPFPPAVRWTYPVDRHDAALSLPSGRVRLGDCVFRRVGAGVDCHCVGAVAVELTNTLHLGAGPLVRLDHPPGPDEPIVIGLTEVTLRHGGPLLECPGGQTETQPGKIAIQAIRCALVPGPEVPLLRFTGEHSPKPLLANVRWTGNCSTTPPSRSPAWSVAKSSSPATSGKDPPPANSPAGKPPCIQPPHPASIRHDCPTGGRAGSGARQNTYSSLSAPL
jgi:hypothetical protein